MRSVKKFSMWMFPKLEPNRPVLSFLSNFVLGFSGSVTSKEFTGG
jgi:hypothetical protein